MPAPVPLNVAGEKHTMSGLTWNYDTSHYETIIGHHQTTCPMSIFSPKLLFNSFLFLQTPTHPPQPQSQLQTMLPSSLKIKSRMVIREQPPSPIYSPTLLLPACKPEMNCPGCSRKPCICLHLYNSWHLLSSTQQISFQHFSLLHQVFTMYWIILIRVWMCYYFFQLTKQNNTTHTSSCPTSPARYLPICSSLCQNSSEELSTLTISNSTPPITSFIFLNMHEFRCPFSYEWTSLFFIYSFFTFT